MKKFLLKYAGALSAFALMIATASANSATPFYFGQAPAPASLKNLRKF